MILLFSKRNKKQDEFLPTEEMPSLAVLIAAYNEEKVIEKKIRSVFNTQYPLSKIKVYLGSDASTDSTEDIVQKLQVEFSNLDLVKFTGRSGKINIINHLQSLGDEEILIMTDANVIFKPETLFQLVKKFKDKDVGIVAANIIKESSTNEGIEFQEKVYLSVENKIKASESNAFNQIMGAEGGCYAIRNDLFSKVPLKFIVDDFFITMQVITRGKKTMFNPLAVCMEDVASDVAGEYKRKVRISSGNFQNMFFFKELLFSFWKPVGFMFWSHKVLRWLTPFFLLFSLLSTLSLATQSKVFFILLLIQLLGLLFPLFNYLIGFKSPLLKFISHFYLMNFALLEGFFRFTKGVKSSIWQPVKRNV
ncbi:MAG: glycosyltransferase [Bacteroidia bacterium]|nr:glycosyltransferase [Bacteroidia bacterium]